MPYKLLKYDPIYEWNEEAALTKLKELYSSTLELADHTINWYQTYRIRKRKMSQGIRILSIFALIASTLMPYLASIFTERDTSLLYIGYIFAGIGGGLLLFDRYYGYSNSWIRFVLTGMELENFRNSFVENWQITCFQNLPLTKQTFYNLVNTLLKFQEEFNKIQKLETETWAKEFQQNLADLIAALKSQGEQIKLTFANKQSQETRDNANLSPSENVPIEVLKEAIEKNYEDWKKYFNVQAISTGQKISENTKLDINCIVFYPSEKIEENTKLFNKVPATIWFKSVNGKDYDIPTDVVSTGGHIQSSVQKPLLLCDKQKPKRPGCSVSRIDIESAGTLGLKVFKGGKSYILSCFHVLCPKELENGTTIFDLRKSIGSISIISPASIDSADNIKIADVVGGELSDQLDCAIAEILAEDLVSEKLCKFNVAPSEYPVVINDEHEKRRYDVKSIGRTSGEINGEIVSAYVNCDIKYVINGKSQFKTIKGLICTSQVSTSGDSGAAVVDMNHNVIGIIVARSESFTFVIPIQRILAKFLVTLKRVS